MSQVVSKKAGERLQVKTEATDGYSAVQVGYRVVKERKITKPELNHLKKSGAPPMKNLREYRVRCGHQQDECPTGHL